MLTVLSRLKLPLAQLLFALLTISCTSQTTAQHKIMCLGNSITQSNQNNYSYRYNLWKKLIDAGIDFDYVGSHSGNKDGNPAWPQYKGKNFDADNEGHWGWSADQILYGNGAEPTKKKLSDWLAGYTPDIVLMHVGTNDMFRNQPVGATLDELREIVRLLRLDNPSVIILMAKLIPAYDQVAGPQAANNIIALNNQIPALVTELNTTLSPVVLVDQNIGFNPRTGEDTWDGIHPNAAGDEKMATVWYNALASFVTPQPVELVAFEGKFVADEGVVLTWKTASEKNNASFEIQRATETDKFEAIGKVAGKGNTQNQTSYTYLDAAPPVGNVYYRLKQQDEDGSSWHSKVIQVYTSPLSADELQVYPTRSQGENVTLKLQFQKPHAAAEVFIYTADGKLVKALKLKSNGSGRFEQELTVKHLKRSNVYFIKALAGEQELHGKFVVDR